MNDKQPRSRWYRMFALTLVFTALLVSLSIDFNTQAALPTQESSSIPVRDPQATNAYPPLVGAACDWGWSDCSPCVNNVEASFATIRTHGDLMGFNLGDHADPEGILENHWQGITRLSTGDGRTMVVSRDHADPIGEKSALAIVSMGSQWDDGDRFHLNRLNEYFPNSWVAPPATDKISKTEYIDTDFFHPGGIQAAGNLLAVGTGNYIHFYIFSDVDPLNPEYLGYIDHSPRNGSGVAITLLDDGRYLLVVAHSDAAVLDFYVSNNYYDMRLTDGFTYLGEWYPSDLIGFYWDAFQSINLVTDCSSGQLYLVGTGNTGPLNFREFGHDWAYLYRLNTASSGETVEIATTGLGAHKTCTYQDQTHCNFDAAAGVYVDAEHQLHLYSTEHWNDGPGGSIKMMQFRSQYNETCNSLNEGWVELFEHDNFRGRSLLIDFPDRRLENYYNYSQAEGFEDQASSIRWCLPKDLTFNLYTDKDPCRGLQRLTGSGTMREISNLHDYGFGDKFSCSEFIIDIPGRLWIDPYTGGVFSYSFPVSSAVQVLSSDADPTITVDVPAGAFPDPVSLEIQPNTPPPHNTLLYVPFGYDFDLAAFDGETPIPILPFDVPVEITINYNEDDLEEITEGTLELYIWDTGLDTWIPATDTCSPASTAVHNTAQNWYSVPVCRTGTYAFMGMLPPQPLIQVLFDEAHAERNTIDWNRALELSQTLPWHPEPEWLYFGDLVTNLAPVAHIDRHVSGELTEDILENYDVLILSAPESPFSGDEVWSINRYVRQGGGLIMLGECGAIFPNPELPGVYGMKFETPCLFEVPGGGGGLDGDMEITDFSYHPAANNVDQYWTNWGSAISITGSAEWLADTWGVSAWTDENDDGIHQESEEGIFPIGATYDVGCGRVAALSDNAFQDDYVTAGNDQLMRSMITWAARGKDCGPGGIYLPLQIRQ